MKNAKEIIGGVLLFLSMLAWGFFLNATGISLETLLGLNGFSKMVSGFLNLNFLLFIVFFPLTIALASSFTQVFERKTIYIQAVSSFAVFGIISLLLFPTLSQFWPVGLAFIIALIIAVESSFVKFQELKTLHFLRAASSAVGQVNTFVAIALFIFTAMFVLPNQEKIVLELEGKAISSVMSGDFTQGLSETASTFFIEGQKQSLQTIISSQQFLALAQKDDPEDIAFVQAASAVFEEVQSPQYEQEVKEKFEESASASLDQEKFMESFNKAKQNISPLVFFEKFFWLFAGLIVSSIYLFVGNIAFKPLGAVYGFLAGLFAQNLEKPSTL